MFKIVPNKKWKINKTSISTTLISSEEFFPPQDYFKERNQRCIASWLRRGEKTKEDPVLSSCDRPVNRDWKVSPPSYTWPLAGQRLLFCRSLKHESAPCTLDWSLHDKPLTSRDPATPLPTTCTPRPALGPDGSDICQQLSHRVSWNNHDWQIQPFPPSSKGLLTYIPPPQGRDALWTKDTVLVRMFCILLHSL